MNTSFNNNILHAVYSNNLKGNTPVLDIQKLQTKIYVELLDTVRGFHPYNIKEIEPLKSDYTLAIGSDVIISNNGHWMDIIVDRLNLSTGLHIYRIDMVNTDNVSTASSPTRRDGLDTIAIFFGYYIQNSDPVKPYIYMNNEEDEEDKTDATTWDTYEEDVN